MSITGPTAASAAVSAATPPRRSRSAHHAAMTASSSSRWAAAPGERGEAGVVAARRAARMTRAATVSLLVDTATSDRRGSGRCRAARCRGARRRGAAAARRARAYTDGSGPIRWNIVSSRLTSTTWPTPRVHGDHRGERRGQPGGLVGEGDRRQQRLPVGLAVDRGEARHRLGDRGEPGSLGVRAVLAEPGDAGDDEPGVARRAGRRDRGRGVPAAGRKFSTSTSASSTRRNRSSWSPASLRSSDERALVAVGQLPPQSLAVAGSRHAMLRRQSPPGRSTLITSAPKSPR